MIFPEVWQIGMEVPIPVPPEDGSILLWDRDRSHILTSFRNPSPLEVRCFSEKDFYFSCHNIDGISFLCFRISDRHRKQVCLPWQEIPYRLRLQNENIPDLLSIEEDDSLRFCFHLSLIDFDSGILLAQRLMTLSHDFSLNFAKMILQDDLIDIDFNRTLQKIFNTYPIGQIAEIGSSRCWGGD